MKTLISNVRLAGDQTADKWVMIDGETIAAVGTGACPDQCAPPCVAASVNRVIDGHGALLLPGVIDCHVHFREPGLTAKADMESESRAAVAGGVTSIIDMPNTKPATTTIEAWEDKCRIAASKCLCNYAFFIGATNDNIDQLKAADYTRIPGVKLFMGSSTGNMLVDSDEMIQKLFTEVPALVAVHAEDQGIIDTNVAAAREKYPQGVPVEQHSAIRSSEACYKSTSKAVSLALRHGARLHICHLSTARELSLLHCGDLQAKQITAEVSPHHLLWCDADYAAKGTRIKMNPAVKTAADRAALRQALQDGLIDMVATDHAPHLLADKQGDALTAASGAPILQFSLPAMLSIADELTVQRAMCHNPAMIYGIKDRGRIEPGYKADLVLVAEVAPYAVADADVVSKCGWTPMAGYTLCHKVQKTWVNGTQVFDIDNPECAPSVTPAQSLVFDPAHAQCGRRNAR